VAEANGGRTHLQRKNTPHTGFEDRAPHRQSIASTRIVACPAVSNGSTGDKRLGTPVDVIAAVFEVRTGASHALPGALQDVRSRGLTFAPYVVLAVGWLAWLIPFVLMKRKSSGKPQTVDRRARVGIGLQSIGYFGVSIRSMRPAETGLLRFTAEVVFLLLGCALSATALRALGRHWRIDAGLNPDHELVRTGPYKLVRHPIYLSMLCMLLAMGFVLDSPVWLAAGVFIFILGTEIRVRVEDSLLESRFGQQFEEYRRTVSAYIPFIR
jgi:protein-S-isoprenylcysteine O-methyltransferase Ste14